MMKSWHIFLGFLLCLGIGIVIGYQTHRNRHICHVEEKIDTLFICDTIVTEKPVYLTRYIKDTIKMVVNRDSVIVKNDTIYLPREVKVYEDSTYRAVVSGVQPSLDSISIFKRESIIYRDKVQYVPKKQRWGIGVSVGYGMGMDGQHIIGTPYIGIGIQYNLLCW